MCQKTSYAPKLSFLCLAAALFETDMLCLCIVSNTDESEYDSIPHTKHMILRPVVVRDDNSVLVYRDRPARPM